MRVSFIFIILIAFSSCKYAENTDIQALKQAENILEIYPDSALKILNAIQYFDKFSEEQKAEYYLLKIRAKDKCYQDISLDTIILKVNKYYKAKNDNLNTAKSGLYSGLILLEQGEYKNAMLTLLEAEEHASNCYEQYNLKGMIQSTIGSLFYQSLIEDEAIKRYRLAANYFALSENNENEAISYNQIGLCFLMKKSQNDSASYYFQKGLQIADQSLDFKLKSAFRHNIGLFWRENDEPNKAIIYFNDAIKYTREDEELTKIFFNIASVYVSQNKIDSAQYFIDKTSALAQSGVDIHIKKYLMDLNSKILKSKGEYKEALALNEEFLDYMSQEYLLNENKSILDIEKKYNYELIKNKHNALQIRNQKWIIFFLILSI